MSLSSILSMGDASKWKSREEIFSLTSPYSATLAATCLAAAGTCVAIRRHRISPAHLAPFSVAPSRLRIGAAGFTAIAAAWTGIRPTLAHADAASLVASKSAAAIKQPAGVALDKSLLHRSAPRHVSFVELLGLLKGEGLRLACAALTIMAFTAASLLTPKTTAMFLDACRNKEDLLIPVASFVGVRALLSALSFLQQYQLSMLAERVKTNLRTRIYSSLLFQEMGFFDVHDRSQLTEMLGQDVATIQKAVTDNIATTLNCVTDIVGSAGRMLFISTKGTMLVLLTLPIVSMGMVIANTVSRTMSMTAFDAQRETMQLATEVLSNPRTIQSFGAESREVARYEKKMDNALNLQRSALLFSGFAMTAFQFLTAALMGGGFWYGGSLVAQDRASVTDILQFAQYSMRIGNSFASLMHVLGDSGKASIAADRVFATIERQPLMPRNQGRRFNPHDIHGQIELRNVDFAYPMRPDHFVVHNTSISLRPGTVTALVGPSGSGKTTIASLVQRFYDPANGQVLIDGEDIRDLELESLRGSIATVSQEPVLLSMSVAENIRYGNPGASIEQIREVARQANAIDFIEKLPEGFDTHVTQAGLSAGQRQRIAIARTLLKDPKILILDETTSQLDAISEAALQTALSVLMKGRTTLVIAHRLSTVRSADNIVVFRDGRVVEQGNHDVLMRLNGAYADLVKKQNQLPPSERSLL